MSDEAKQSPRSAREALYAEILQDLSWLMDRQDALMQLFKDLQQSLTASSSTLESASEKYRAGVQEFTDSARKALSAQLTTEGREAAKALSDELKATIRMQAHLAFEESIKSEVSELVSGLNAAREAQQKAARTRWVELLGVSILAALMTTLGLKFLM